MKPLTYVLLFALVEAQAQSVGDIFGGVTYTKTSIKDESSKNLGTFNPTVVGLGLAYVVAENIALEGNVFDGTSDSSVTRTGVGTVTVKVHNGYGVGVRPFLSLNGSWGIYAKLGRQYGTQTTVIKKSIDSKFAHTVYGLGISYNINSKWGISADYALSKKIESEMNKNNSVGMSVRYTF